MESGNEEKDAGDKIVSKFAAFLKAERDRQGCTQAELAERMGMRFQTLSAMSNGKRLNVNLIVFLRMAKGVPSWPRRIEMFKAVYDDAETGKLSRQK